MSLPFTTRNRGLAAAFLVNGFEPERIYKNDQGSIILEYVESLALRDVFESWRGRTLVVNAQSYNDASYGIRDRIKKAID